MNEVRGKLSPQERALLSNLWEDHDTMKALRSALSHKQLELALMCMAIATDYNQVMDFRGQIKQGKWLNQFLKFNFQEGEKARKKAEQASQVAE